MFDKRRNPQAKKIDEVQKALLAATRCDSVCWLPGDSNEPITTGHADALLSFAIGNVVLFHWIDDETNPEYGVCDYNLRVFQEWAKCQRRE
jgi:agmatine deiminase